MRFACGRWELRDGRLAVPALALLLAVFFGAPRAGASTGQLVRVGIALNQDALQIQADGPVDLGDPSTQAVTRIGAGTHEVRTGALGVEVDGVHFGPVVRFQPVSGRLQTGGRAYRGVMEVRRTPAGRLTMINELDLEEYLYGVLKMEIDPRWPAEAVRAQAVAARTLALSSLGRFAAEGYDLRATTESQVYGGVNAEDARTGAAVEATRGVVMTFGGRPIFAAYHSDSGGSTENSEYVWGGAYPYLRGVSDPYSLESPGREWLARFDLPTFESRLRRMGKHVAGTTRVAVASISPSGRAVAVRVTGSHGVLEIRGVDLRQALGSPVLRSTLFTVSMPPAEEGAMIEFAGRGSGHGVGMSQWGARGQALLGRSYLEILKHYYQGIALERR